MATHFSLLKLEDVVEGRTAPGLGLGAPKNDVMLPLALGFFASAAGVDRWLASRLTPLGLGILATGSELRGRAENWYRQDAATDSPRLKQRYIEKRYSDTRRHVRDQTRCGENPFIAVLG